jgi:hypothetical protein
MESKMNLEQHTTPATVQAIYAHYEAKRKGKSHRPHLGGSQIGNECHRALWYQFRWAWSPQFEGRMLRLFETGDREEERIVRNLRDVGVTVWEKDPETGKQVSFTAHGGHFALSLDGVGEGFAESGAPHVLEFKTMNKKAFADISRKGLQVSKPIYWAQVQVGMHLAGLDRAYFFAVEKDTDAIYAERVRLDQAEAMKLVAKAGQIIFAETPPSRISDDPSFFGCKFCPYFAVCHGCKIPEVHCRTCAHVTPQADGTWNCARGKEAGKACQDHLFIPQMMPPDLEVHDAGETWVEYMDKDTGEIVRNEDNSLELHEGRMK